MGNHLPVVRSLLEVGFRHLHDGCRHLGGTREWRRRLGSDTLDLDAVEYPGTGVTQALRVVSRCLEGAELVARVHRVLVRPDECGHRIHVELRVRDHDGGNDVTGAHDSSPEDPTLSFRSDRDFGSHIMALFRDG